MTDDDQSNMSAGRREREAMYSDYGYVFVRIDYNSPPGDALGKVATYESLDEIGSIPSDTEWEGTWSTTVKETRTPTKTSERSATRVLISPVRLCSRLLLEELAHSY
jgi:hypothetical protein